MEQPNHTVKIPCNHKLVFGNLKLLRVRALNRSSDQTGAHTCDGCSEEFGYGYYCRTCKFGAHVECIDFPDTINHPCHSIHPLKKVSVETIDYTDGSCHFCMSPLRDPMYHCSMCNFSLDVPCVMCPPQRTIYVPKSHKHPFTLMPRRDDFTCNACGMVGDRNPYVCLECGFMLHKDCIDLPRVININRHEHRVSRTYHLGHGDWECGVCRIKIDWTCGAFSCKRCPNYAVHSKCATRDDVWDGEELEDEPEEEEIEDPYEVINEGEILHFGHEHNLKLSDDNDDDDVYKNMRCYACVLPINLDTFFKCVDCKFFLHKDCASLPRMKRNILHKHKIKLLVDYEAHLQTVCEICLRLFDGFRYKCNSDCNESFSGFLLDVRCASISEPFYHELHNHPLYRTSTEEKICGACGEESEYVLSCIVCEFSLGMECATLPRKVKHRCDDHVLSLHHGAGSSKGQLWCDICEGKTNPDVWFYGCEDCGITLHIKCVLGDMYYLKPGNNYEAGNLILNDGMSRPFCLVCEKRCIFPSFLKGIAKSDSSVVYACSLECAKEAEWYSHVDWWDCYKQSSSSSDSSDETI